MVEVGGPVNSSRRNFIRIGAGLAVGAAIASVIEIPSYDAIGGEKDAQIASLESQLGSYSQELQQLKQLEAQATQLTAETAALQSQISGVVGLAYLSTQEQTLLESVAETIIPTDSNGPGAKEAGVLYFIDRQLGGEYGSSGTMYMKGPFVLSGQTGPITVGSMTFPGGTPVQRLQSGTRYQYQNDMRYFWKWGLAALQAYANSAYGNDFENLGSSEKLQVLSDIWDNKPTAFNDIVPEDFAYELFFMVWNGFLTDPLYGGNQNMVGWTYTGFNGVNMGNFYGEGHTPQELMVATTPTRLRPASIGLYQQRISGST